MELMVLALVFIPMILLLIALLFGGKTFRSSLIVSSVIFLVTSIVLYFYPSIIIIKFPVLFWKFFSLLTVFLIFFYSTRDKHHFISILTMFQAFMLIIFEISFSPAEPSVFLSLNHKELLLVLSGGFIIITFIPFIVYCYRKRCGDASSKQKRRFIAGFLFMLSSFAGLISAQSMTGLFLFWQFQYISTYFFLRSNECVHDKRTKFVPYIQQAALTLFLASNIITYEATGSLAMQNFSVGFGPMSGLTAVVIFMTIILMGLLIPEYYLLRFNFFENIPLPSLTGMYLIIVSIIMPYGILRKFMPLFQNLNKGLITLFVLYGAILVFAGAYYALVYKRNKYSLNTTILCIAGLGVATSFKDYQSSADFLYSNPLSLLIVISGIVLIAAFIIEWVSYLFVHVNTVPETDEQFLPSAFFPFKVNFKLLIRIGWITTAALILGVALSCLG